MISKHEKFVFDLDRTIWDVFNIFGQKIWAKQLIPPYTISGTDIITIIDDVGSFCQLRSGIREYLEDLNKKNKKISFLSVGALWKVANNKQPSIKILQLFQIYNFFNDQKILMYKTKSKKNHLQKIGKCVFFDDNEKNLNEARQIKNILAVDSSNIKDWKRYCE